MSHQSSPDRAEVLRKSRDTYSSKLLEFLRATTKNPKTHILFFEGHDSKYYGNRFNIIQPDLTWHGISCGGKENVIKLFTLITTHKHHAALNSLYFIDRDFDDLSELPTDERLYITPGYSVENLYVNERTFSRILKEEFNLSEHAEGDDSFNKCILAFKKALDSFTNAVAELNGWIILQRRHEKSHPGLGTANLNSINLNKHVSIGLDFAIAKFDLTAIERPTNSIASFSSLQAHEAVDAIHQHERQARFRGKFQAYFLRVYLTKLIDDANSPSPKLVSQKHPCPLTVSDKNLLSELSQHADTPQCLREFLGRARAK